MKRTVDPRVRAREEAIGKLDLLDAERRRLLLAGEPVPRKLASDIKATEEAMSKSVAATVPCERCGTKINLAKDAHYRVAVLAIERYQPGAPKPEFVEYLSTNAQGRYEEGALGIVVALAPPEQGDTARCIDCGEHLMEYQDDLLPEGATDEYRLKVKHALRQDEAPEASDATRRTSKRKKKE